MTDPRAGQRGEGRLRLIIALLLTAALITAVVRIVPVYVKSFEFRETVREEARLAVVRQSQHVEMRNRLLEKARQLGLPMQPEQINIRPGRGGGVEITVNYSVPVKLPGYLLTLNFNAAADTASAY